MWSSEPIAVQGEITSLGRDEIADANLQCVSFPGSELRRLITPPWSRSGDLSVATLWLVIWLPHGNPFLECARWRRAAGP
jgi:hypothetical protein